MLTIKGVPRKSPCPAFLQHWYRWYGVELPSTFCNPQLNHPGTLFKGSQGNQHNSTGTVLLDLASSHHDLLADTRNTANAQQLSSSQVDLKECKFKPGEGNPSEHWNALVAVTVS